MVRKMGPTMRQLTIGVAESGYLSKVEARLDNASARGVIFHGRRWRRHHGQGTIQEVFADEPEPVRSLATAMGLAHATESMPDIVIVLGLDGDKRSAIEAIVAAFDTAVICWCTDEPQIYAGIEEVRQWGKCGMVRDIPD